MRRNETRASSGAVCVCVGGGGGRNHKRGGSFLGPDTEPTRVHDEKMLSAQRQGMSESGVVDQMPLVHGPNATGTVCNKDMLNDVLEGGVEG